MRKILFVLIIFMAAGFTLAGEEGIGLSFGLEFGIDNINKANEEEMVPYLMPMIIYEQSFLDEDIDVYAELGYTFGFNKVPKTDGDKTFPQSLYLDLIFGYNLGLGSSSILSFIVENKFDEIIISPRLDESNNITGIFTPAVKFTQELGFGDPYAQIGAPITYVQYDKDADTEIGLDFTIGWKSTFGLGLEAKVLTLLSPGDDAGYAGLEAIISYKTGPFYFEVEAIIPQEISDEGVTLTPEFDYSLRRLTFYLSCEFTGIGVDDGGVSVSPALGVKYSF